MIVYEKAPAKINLSLDVLYKRDDGYHEVEMVMACVDLADRLEIRELDEDRIVLSSPVGFLPLDEKNLAYQAASIIKETYGIRRGVHIHLEKHIPVAAGLAGGSSDAAATLRGLNRLWGLGLSLEELLELASRLGSDVPFCVMGKAALATGRGEKVKRIPSPPPCWVVLAKPPANVSTADIYKKLDVQKIRWHPPTEKLLQAMEAGDFDRMCSLMGNVLEEVTMEMYPQVRQLKESMLKFGAKGALMSGSGPTVFGLVKREHQAARLVNGLRGFCREVYAVRMLG